MSWKRFVALLLLVLEVFALPALAVVVCLIPVEQGMDPNWDDRGAFIAVFLVTALAAYFATKAVASEVPDSTLRRARGLLAIAVIMLANGAFLVWLTVSFFNDASKSAADAFWLSLLWLLATILFNVCFETALNLFLPGRKPATTE